MKSNTNSSCFCPIPWTHLSVGSVGELKVCCAAIEGKNLVDEESRPLYLDNNFSLKNYSAGSFMKKVRKEMLEGVWPSFCTKCFEAENKGGSSLRTVYLQKYSEDELNTFASETKNDGEYTVVFKTLDFSLGNTCNLKCRTCSPYYSNALVSDWDKLGIEYSRMQLDNGVKRWASFFKDQELQKKLFKDLKHVYLWGGEPLISPFHQELLLALKKFSQASSLELDYNTNLTILPEGIDLLWRDFSSIQLGISLDGSHLLNDYIRYPSNWKDIDDNLQIVFKLAESLPIEIKVCTVLQALNLTRIEDLLSYLLKYKKQMVCIPHFILLDFPYYLDARVLPGKMKDQALISIESFLEENNDEFLGEFSKQNFENISSLRSFLKEIIETSRPREHFFDFILYNKKIDKLRGQNLFQVCPEFISDTK